MSYTKLHDEEVVDLVEDWSAPTQVYVEDGSGKVYIEQGDDSENSVVFPKEYVPGIIKALEKALEKP